MRDATGYRVGPVRSIASIRTEFLLGQPTATLPIYWSGRLAGVSLAPDKDIVACDACGCADGERTESIAYPIKRLQILPRLPSPRNGMAMPAFANMDAHTFLLLASALPPRTRDFEAYAKSLARVPVDKRKIHHPKHTDQKLEKTECG
jgi:hypothetical protein